MVEISSNRFPLSPFTSREISAFSFPLDLARKAGTTAASASAPKPTSDLTNPNPSLSTQIYSAPWQLLFGSEPMMLLHKQKNSHTAARNGRRGNRLLIIITLPGSTGPIRLVVNEEQLVVDVIQSTLKSYARERRLPILGSNLDDFVLYCAPAGTEALNPLETIGSTGSRYFMLCKKPKTNKAAIGDGKRTILRKGSGSWMACLNKSLNIKISGH